MILGTSTCKPTHVCKYANKLVKQKNADEGKWGNVKQLGKEGSIFLPQKIVTFTVMNVINSQKPEF